MEWRVLSPRDEQEDLGMKRYLIGFAAAGPFLLAVAASPPVSAQKQGGTLTIGHFDSPASISLLEESTNAVNRPITGVFNNLVMYDQNVPQNSPKSIVPDLATSWSWNEEGTELTLPLRQGVNGTTADLSPPMTSNAPWIC
jgi:peptide/nickel transport system substrate-binding protein